MSLAFIIVTWTIFAILGKDPVCHCGSGRTGSCTHTPCFEGANPPCTPSGGAARRSEGHERALGSVGAQPGTVPCPPQQPSHHGSWGGSMRRCCSLSAALLRPRAAGAPRGGLLLTYIFLLVNSSDPGLLSIRTALEGGVINVARVT